MKVLLRLFLVALVLLGLNACKQPKADESCTVDYGPIQKVYELPKVKGTVYFVAPDGDPDAKGVKVAKPTTIESAISKVVSGDAIVMRGGTYRTGNLTFNQGITIQPYRDEKPVIKGSLVAENWGKVSENLWVTDWEFLFPAGPEDWWVREWNEKYTPMHRFNNDGVFIDGQYLQSAGSIDEIDEATFFVDYGAKQIYIGTNPEGRFIEITAFRKAIFRTVEEVHGKLSDGRGPVIRGLEITQYPDTMVHIDGYYPQGMSSEDQHGKDVIGSVLENCTFSNCFRIAVFAIGDSLVMRHCEVRNSNTEGVYIVASSDVLLERNIFAFNNIERWTGFYPSAVKIFNQTYRVVCRDNKIIDHPHSNGLWYDVGNIDGIFVNNWVENVGMLDDQSAPHQFWANANGFFFEISEGVICAGNTFLNCDQGLLILNAKGAEIYNNTFVNSRVSIGRDTRGDDADHFGWHITTGPGVEDRDEHKFVNNLVAMNIDYPKPLFHAWQHGSLCKRLSASQLNEMDFNVYVRQKAEAEGVSTILWSPFENKDCVLATNNLSDLAAVNPLFEANSKYFPEYTGPLFVDAEACNFNLAEGFEGRGVGTEIPEKIVNAMQLCKSNTTFVGAYPVCAKSACCKE